MGTWNQISRRGFLAGSSLQLLMTRISRKAYATAGDKRFRLWATGCPHVGNDIRQGPGREPRESLGDAIRQSESSAGFDWDIALCAGDFSGHQGIPPESEGREVVRQFSALKKHSREQFYCLGGNHDASPENAWFQRWVDPLGEHTEDSGVDPRRRPYAVEGSWERYCFRVGNLLFAMMSDRNDYAPPVGRIADGKGLGGRPPGAVTLETLRWWQRLLKENPDAIIISAHHHMLKETTATSGPWEGFRRDEKTGKWRGYTHGYFPADAKHNMGAGYLYWLVDESQSPIDARADAQAFEKHMAANPGAIDLWIGGHSHMEPNAVVGGRTHLERKWDVDFLNCCALTKYHGGRAPMSRLLTFVDGSDRVQIQCYLHTSDFAPQGWYPQAEESIKLSKPFRL